MAKVKKLTPKTATAPDTKPMLVKIDQEESISIAQQLLDCCNGQPLEKTSTILNGMVMAVISVAKSAKRYEVSPGSVERMILSWFATSDKACGTEFCKYLKLE